MGDYIVCYIPQCHVQSPSAEFPMADKVGGGGGGGGRGGEGGEGKEGSGILLGKRFAVSCLFSSDDQSLATSVLSQQGGIYMYIHKYISTCTPCMYVRMCRIIIHIQI